MKKAVYICDAVRTPIGKYGGSLSSVRTDDLAAIPIAAILERNKGIIPENIDDVIFGCANQAGEDNRNVARMALLLAGLPQDVPGVTVNRLCGSGMEAVGQAAKAIMSDEAQLIIAGGVESMSRAPFVIGKAVEAFSRNAEIFDTTIGWRFINNKMKHLYGTDTMIETAEILAVEMNISREEQDRFAYNSQLKTKNAQQRGDFLSEICPVIIPQKKGNTVVVSTDEHPRLSTVDELSQLKTVLGKNGTVTAGNSSGINDGAAALLIASEDAVAKYQLKALAKILGMQSAGVPPRIMGIGPVPATQKLLVRLCLNLEQMNIIELNEAFASQSLACIRQLGLRDDDARINPLGGAIALGHPLGMSGARLVITAVHHMQKSNAEYALASMCIGVGQGIAMVLQKV